MLNYWFASWQGKKNNAPPNGGVVAGDETA